MSASELPRPVSRETSQQLETYVALLKKWTQRINLVSAATLDDVWQRHIADSIQVFDASDISSGSWVDLGSGGGLPGAIIAILARTERPDLHVTCVESDLRKATFLRSVSRETGCEFSVLNGRIEEIPAQKADIVSARALAPLPRLLGYVERHLSDEGVAILPKGSRHKEELTDAEKQWIFDYETLPSATDQNAVILRIRGIERVRA